MEKLKLEIQKMQQGNFQDYESFYSLSADYIYYLIRSAISDEQAAQGILVDTYNQIYKEIGTLENPDCFYVWAGRIATTKITEYLKMSNMLGGVEDIRDDSFPFETLADDSEAFIPENILTRTETMSDIQAMIEALSTEQKLVMQFFYLENMSVSQIAERTGYTVGAVRKSLSAVRKQLKDIVGTDERKAGIKLQGMCVIPVIWYAFWKKLEVMTAGRAGLAGLGNAVMAGNAGFAGAGNAAMDKDICLAGVGNAAMTKDVGFAGVGNAAMTGDTGSGMTATGGTAGEAVGKGIGIGAKIGIGVVVAAIIGGGAAAIIMHQDKGDNNDNNGKNQESTFETNTDTDADQDTDITLGIASDTDDTQEQQPVSTTEATTEATTEVTTEVTTEETTEETTEAATTEVTIAEAEYCSVYLDILNEKEYDCSRYSWQSGYSEEPEGEALPVNMPIALYDVTGDGVPELFVMYAEEDYVAKLDIYTVDKDGKAKTMYSEGIDYEVAGGTDFLIFATSDGKLYHENTISDEWSNTIYSEMVVDGDIITEKTIMEKVIKPNENNSGTISEYKVDGKDVDKKEFAKVKNKIYGKMTDVIQLNYGRRDYVEERKDNLTLRYMTWSDAFKRLIGDDNPKQGQLPIKYAVNMLFSSGAGAWCTGLELNPDGSFTGDYHDSNMGESGEGYQATVYVSSFKGRFKDIKKVDEYTYSMTLDSYELEEVPGKEWIDNNPDSELKGTRYVASEPYGIYNGKTFYFYLPGIAVSELPEEYVNWIYGLNQKKTLDCYGLYNVEEKQGFGN